jgi:hypothetical protein
MTADISASSRAIMVSSKYRRTADQFCRSAASQAATDAHSSSLSESARPFHKTKARERQVVPARPNWETKTRAS